ncbi:DNA-3-methyladenine glycosylase I [Larsenimonas sp. GH3-8]|uniref:DNA-3-methyladenine glycosylase I n=2 Tax=Larsenimonas rhizosphaerae TaxID=2944682 RepID=A0AA41ZEZ2_9GAMM|nr:DNA-3-methyladenine glycosylase I [Larsenimonas rhizosphaerae]MCM2129401.1 DNA-3-methyladenine glycosylase I [Larsenimonas rhizosphaerae]MCX2524057.1 DNA-3-methyladenine glycosylase I [Larsenimonas rhizosphaerae]
MEGSCVRCNWPGNDPQMIAYHDTEWGVPEYDSRALWEKLMLDGFQAGLSWRTILHKREAFREAFAGFEPARVADFTEADVERLMGNAGIVRSRRKIEGVIRNARAWLAMHQAGEPFDEFVWASVKHTPVQAGEVPIPTQTETSVALSKALRKRGFTFAGPVIVYAWMQATGMINDHTHACFRHAEVAALS